MGLGLIIVGGWHKFGPNHTMVQQPHIEIVQLDQITSKTRLSWHPDPDPPLPFLGCSSCRAHTPRHPDHPFTPHPPLHWPLTPY